MEAEGWYHDPYGQHEARWFSAGRPTALVRDDHQEAHDDPPPDPIDGTLEPFDEPPTAESGDDFRRADSKQAGPESSER